MEETRRKFIASLVKTAGAVGAIFVALPSTAEACLYGTWHVMCANHHINVVSDGTCQHKCEQCGLQVFTGYMVTVVCRNGHQNRITTGAGDRQHVTQSYKCNTCHTECRFG